MSLNLTNGTEGFNPMMFPEMGMMNPGMGILNPILLPQQQIIMNILLM